MILKPASGSPLAHAARNDKSALLALCRKHTGRAGVVELGHSASNENEIGHALALLRSMFVSRFITNIRIAQNLGIAADRAVGWSASTSNDFGFGFSDQFGSGQICHGCAMASASGRNAKKQRK